jgi:hypothetical protein
VNEFIVVRHNPNSWPQTEAMKVRAADCSSACCNSGWMMNEIVSVRINLNIEPVQP